MKKTIIVPISGEEIIVNVDFSIIEKVERVYNCTAEVAAAIHLTDMMRIRRTHIAQIICLWVQGKTELKQSVVNEYVQTCAQNQLYKFAGMIQAAILFSIRGEDGQPLITSEQFDKLINGEDLEEPPKGEGNQKGEEKPKAKKPRKATSRKRTS
jgi:hypothetical protein